jgi:hypothetical protein
MALKYPTKTPAPPFLPKRTILAPLITHTEALTTHPEHTSILAPLLAAMALQHQAVSSHLHLVPMQAT